MNQNKIMLILAILYCQIIFTQTYSLNVEVTLFTFCCIQYIKPTKLI